MGLIEAKRESSALSLNSSFRLPDHYLVLFSERCTITSIGERLHLADCALEVSQIVHDLIRKNQASSVLDLFRCLVTAESPKTGKPMSVRGKVPLAQFRPNERESVLHYWQPDLVRLRDPLGPDWTVRDLMSYLLFAKSVRTNDQFLEIFGHQIATLRAKLNPTT